MTQLLSYRITQIVIEQLHSRTTRLEKYSKMIWMVEGVGEGDVPDFWLGFVQST